MKYIPVQMVREHMRDIPDHPLPAGLVLRPHRAGDEPHWANVETRAGEFTDEATALARFHANFEGNADELSRCFYLCTAAGEVVGTATASSDPWQGAVRGRVSWVGLVPEYQGRGLSKPLLATVMRRIAEDYDAAFLGTQTTSYRAVGLYQRFGFRPFRTRTPEDDEAWRLIEEALGRPIG